MNNSIGFSQESYGFSAETDTRGTEMSRERELDSHGDIGILNQYTFHRHSAPKNVIYFRCSDKRCPARLHFDTLSKSFSMKNRHLDASTHKSPVVTNAIKASDLITNPNFSKRGSIILDLNLSQQASPFEFDSLIPQVRSNGHLSIDPDINKRFMLRFKSKFPEKIPEFRQILLDKCLASNIVSFSAGKKFTNEICEEKTEFAIEVYTVSHFIVKVLIHVNDYFGRGVEVLFYSLE